MLLGQTVNSYNDGDARFRRPASRGRRGDGIRRLRFTSPHPNDFSDRVIAAMAEVDAVCEHVHLPMQSRLDAHAQAHAAPLHARGLSRLRRRGCARRFPGSSLTTDIIVGFPGETDEDFEETLSAVREVGFADAFTFKFSPRDGTPATRMPAELTVPDEVASERLAAAGRRRCAPSSRARNLELLGTAARSARREGSAARRRLLQARTRDFKTVLVPGDASHARPVLHRGAHRHDRLDVHGPVA